MEQHRDLGVLAPLLGRLFGHELQGSERGETSWLRWIPAAVAWQLSGTWAEPAVLRAKSNQTW